MILHNSIRKIAACIAFHILLFTVNATGQTIKPCGTDEMHKRMVAKDPSLKKIYDSIEIMIRRKKQELTQNRVLYPGAPYRIQTVVHVLGTDANTNPTDANIRTMIASINTNLRGQDPDLANLPAAFADEQAGNTFIELCLTDVGPNQLPTTGIVRTVTNTNNYFINYGTTDQFFMSATDPSMGGTNIWNRDFYLNIIITPTLFDDDDAGSGQRVGVSAFPGDPANRDCYIVNRPNMQQDGAHTHELGHWLNLIHIWGDTTDCSRSDQVDDTPFQSDNSQAKNSTCTFPQLSCNNGPDGDMYMNYMDYSNCYSMFTNGQETRMVDALNFVRYSLFQNNCASDVTLFGAMSGMYRAANNMNNPVSGSATVFNGSSAYFQAGTRITLKPGFRANSGSYAKFSIKPCCSNQ